MYEAYLKALLEPLGVYDLGAGTINGAELAALGTGLDEIGTQLETAEREALFARRPAAVTPEERRAAIAALLQIDGDSLTPEAINRTLGGCGIKAWAQEMGDGHLRVRFPEVAGVPLEFEQMKPIILDILPCHLEVEFYFRYLTWAECEAAGYTWAEIEEAGHTWESFQLAVPPETEAP